jgi:hypothetical protein
VRRLARRAHGEFVHVRLAEQHGSGAREAIDDVGIERRRVIGSIREPQVVRMPAVTRMSLCAIGMPSAAAVALPIRSSAARASAMARPHRR